VKRIYRFHEPNIFLRSRKGILLNVVYFLKICHHIKFLDHLVGYQFPKKDSVSCSLVNYLVFA
jgi:hypothetical protein